MSIYSNKHKCKDKSDDFDLYQWMDDKKHILYVAFGTLVGADPINKLVFICLLNDVFDDTFLEKHNYYIVWSMRGMIHDQSFIFDKHNNIHYNW